MCKFSEEFVLLSSVVVDLLRYRVVYVNDRQQGVHIGTVELQRCPNIPNGSIFFNIRFNREDETIVS